MNEFDRLAQTMVWIAANLERFERWGLLVARDRSSDQGVLSDRGREILATMGEFQPTDREMAAVLPSFEAFIELGDGHIYNILRIYRDDPEGFVETALACPVVPGVPITTDDLIDAGLVLTRKYKNQPPIPETRLDYLELYGMFRPLIEQKRVEGETLRDAIERWLESVNPSPKV